MPAETTGRRRRAGLCALLAAACVAWGVGGCGSPRSDRDTGSARTGPGAVQDPPPSETYGIPQPVGVCEAVRGSGIAVSTVTPDRTVEHRTSCTVQLGTDPEAHPHALRVRFLNEVTPGRATATYNRMRDADWTGTHSPVSGRASERREVPGIGAATAGREYDDGYYAYFPGVVVAGVPYSQSVVVLRRGNVLLEFDLLGGDRTGRRAIYMKPAPPAVATKAFDDTADELLSLITPA